RDEEPLRTFPGIALSGRTLPVAKVERLLRQDVEAGIDDSAPDHVAAAHRQALTAGIVALAALDHARHLAELHPVAKLVLRERELARQNAGLDHEIAPRVLLQFHRDAPHCKAGHANPAVKKVGSAGAAA